MALEVFYSEGRLQTAGGRDISGEVLANTDQLQFGPGDVTPSGTATVVAQGAWVGVNLPATGTSGVAISRNFPSNWGTASMSFGYSPLTANGGNVRWQMKVYRVNALGFGDLITDAAATTDLVTQVGGTQFQLESVLIHPANFQVHNTDGLIGDVTNVTIERLGDDAADTHTGAMLLFNVTLVRTS